MDRKTDKAEDKQSGTQRLARVIILDSSSEISQQSMETLRTNARASSDKTQKAQIDGQTNGRKDRYIDG